MMRTVRRAPGAWIALVVLASPLGSRAATVTLLHVNDTHSHLDAVGPKDRHLDGTLGGLAKAASVIAAQKAANPSALLVHAGDLFQGDAYFNVTYGVPELQILAQLGLDAMAVGNHELHLGPEVLAGVLAQAFPGGASPLLSANLDLTSFPPLGPFVAADALKVVDGVRVGLFGLTTPFDAAMLPDPVVVRADFAQIAAAEVEHLRLDLGAEVVVLLSHLGFELDKALAAAVPGLDAIVGGHDHLLLAEPFLAAGPGGKQVPIVQAGEFYEQIGKLTLSVAAGRVSLASYELLPVGPSVPRLPQVAAAVAGIQEAASAVFGSELFHTPVAFALLDVAKDPGPLPCLRDTGVGNLVTDALRHRTGTDLGLTVNGLLPEGIARGWVVGDDLFRTVGDGLDPEAVKRGAPGGAFPLFTLDISGAELLRALASTVALGGDLFVQGSGLSYAFDPRKPPGQQLVSARVLGRPVDPSRIYTATVNLGVLQGLPQLGVQVANVRPVAGDEFQAVRDWARRLRLLLYTPQGRIRDLSARCR